MIRINDIINTTNVFDCVNVLGCFFFFGCIWDAVVYAYVFLCTFPTGDNILHKQFYLNAHAHASTETYAHMHKLRACKRSMKTGAT